MAAELFGLSLLPLYFAIAQVESRNGRDPTAFGNIYQISRVYIEDLNRIYTYHRDWKTTVIDRVASEYAIYDYWRFYAYKYAKETGNPITYEVLAKMHNRGGRYWTKTKSVQQAADEYWQKVRTVMETMKHGSRTER